MDLDLGLFLTFAILRDMSGDLSSVDSLTCVRTGIACISVRQAESVPVQS